MRCTSCEKNLCGLKHENSRLCDQTVDGAQCKCKCGISERQYWLTKGSYIGGGIVSGAVGASLTTAASGFSAVVLGPMLVSAAFPLVVTPIYKYCAGERVTVDEATKDVALGAAVGAVTGTIGSAGSSMAGRTAGALKVGLRAATSSTVGAANSVLYNLARLRAGEQIASSDLQKTALQGAVIGSVGGMSSEVANGVAGFFNNGFLQSMTRVALTGLSSATTDAGIQIYETGEVDPKRVAVNTAGQVTLATVAEASTAKAQRTQAYNNKVNAQLLKDRKVETEVAREIREAISEANSLIDPKLERGRYLGERNVHKLYREKAGQYAADIGTTSIDGKRGCERVIMEKVGGKFVYADHTMSHDYKDSQQSVPSHVKKPIEGQMAHTKFFGVLKGDVEEESEDKSEHEAGRLTLIEKMRGKPINWLKHKL